MRGGSHRVSAWAGLLLAGVAAGSPRAEDRAVVVGIDDYAALGAGVALGGAVADAERVRAALVGPLGFAPSQVTLLLDGDATSEAILSALTDELIGRTAPGDRAFLYFAGLGTRVAEDDATALALVAWDAEGLLGLIPEDLVADLLDLVPDRRVTVVVDAGFDGAGGFDGPVRGRGWPGEPAAGAWTPFGQGGVARAVWSAAGAGGLAWEAGGAGVFTSAWLAAQEAGGPDAEVLEEVRARTGAWCEATPACAATGRGFEPAFTDQPRPPEPEALSFDDRVRLLMSLAREGGGPALRLSMDGGAALRMGEEATLRIDAEGSGTLLLLDLQDGTGLTVASDGMALPEEGAALRFRVAEPAGKGALIGVLIGEGAADPAAAMPGTPAADPDRFLAELASRLRSIGPEAWSAALLPYEVVR